MSLYLKINGISHQYLKNILIKYLLIYLNSIYNRKKLTNKEYNILYNAFLHISITQPNLNNKNVFMIGFDQTINMSEIKLINYGNLEQKGTNIVTNAFDWIKINIKNILKLEKMKRR